jgi:hypothetical protein
MGDVMSQIDRDGFIEKLAEEFVVVAGRVLNVDASAGQIKHMAKESRVGRRPSPTTTQSPSVDDVTDQVQSWRFDRLYQSQEFLNVGVRRTEMTVAEEEGVDGMSLTRVRRMRSVSDHHRRLPP